VFIAKDDFKFLDFYLEDLTPEVLVMLLSLAELLQ